jgi:hypothetical protein
MATVTRCRRHSRRHYRRQVGAAVPQQTAVSSGGHHGRSAPIADFRAWRLQRAVDAMPTPGNAAFPRNKLVTASATGTFPAAHLSVFDALVGQPGPKATL